MTPNDPKIIFKDGLEKIENKKYDEAFFYFQAKLNEQKKPNSSTTVFIQLQIAKIYTNTGAFDAAMAILGKLSRIQNLIPYQVCRIYAQQAMCHSYQGNYDQAERSYDQIKNLDFPEVYYTQAALLEARGEFSSAINVIKVALAKEGWQENDLLCKKAEQLFHKLIEQQVNEPNARYSYAEFLYRHNRTEQALEQINLVKEQFPAYRPANSLYQTLQPKNQSCKKYNAKEKTPFFDPSKNRYSLLNVNVESPPSVAEEKSPHDKAKIHQAASKDMQRRAKGRPKKDDIDAFLNAEIKKVKAEKALLDADKQHSLYKTMRGMFSF